MSKPKCEVIWHEKSNILATVDTRGGLPMINVCDDEYSGINPFYAYPLEFLYRIFGWIKIGEL